MCIFSKIEEIKYNENNIYIIQGERNDNKLLFMYKPFVNTLLKIFEKYDCKFLYNNWEIADLKEKDIIIFVGNTERPNFLELKEKGIYTIWYWTEPSPIKTKYIVNCDEVYVYSKTLFYEQKKEIKNQIVRFIPILKEDTESITSYINKTKDTKLCFLGKLKHRTEHTQNLFLKKKYFIERFDLFDELEYNRFIVNECCIFLNVNKGSSVILPFCRICKLLSHGCIIISQECDKKDQELFKDLVYFCHVDKVEKTFKKLLERTGEELNEISKEIIKKFEMRLNVNNKNLFLKK